MASNLIDITSPEQFKKTLSKDLKRVSCLNFWAPWAEPCEAFNKEIQTAAGKYPTVLFLNVSLHMPRCEMQSRRNCFDVSTKLTPSSSYLTLTTSTFPSISIQTLRLKPNRSQTYQNRSTSRLSHQCCCYA